MRFSALSCVSLRKELLMIVTKVITSARGRCFGTTFNSFRMSLSACTRSSYAGSSLLLSRILTIKAAMPRSMNTVTSSGVFRKYRTRRTAEARISFSLISDGNFCICAVI